MSKLLLQDTFFSALGAVEDRVRKIEERNATIAASGGGGSLTIGSVMDAHVASNAAIQLTKLAQDPRARSTHTGTQLANTISDLQSAMAALRLDQFALPTASVNLNNQKITSLAEPTAFSDATTKNYVDTKPLNLLGMPTGNVYFNSVRLTGVSTPTAVDDAATKGYVDTAATAGVLGLDAKQSVKVATTANITLSGTQTIDGNPVNAGDRVLVKNQSSGSANGIYVAATGAWTRATDADTSAKLNAANVFVEVGSTLAKTVWACDFPTGNAIGPDPITWRILPSTIVTSKSNTAGAVLAANTTLDNIAVPVGGYLDMNFGRLTNLADPAFSYDAATRGYVDSVAQGLDAKQSVVTATSANIALSGTQTINAVAVVAGNRVLVKNQTLPKDNGIYVVAAGAWTRAPDMDTAAEFVSAYTFVENGNLQTTGWVCPFLSTSVLGTDAVNWYQFSGAGQITDGIGLLKTGNTLDVRLDGTTIEAPGDILQVKALGLTDAHVATVNKDGANATPSMRTLGYGAGQAVPGNGYYTSMLVSPSGHLGLGGGRVTGMGDPVASNDAATKQYVDGVAQGLDVKGSVKCIAIVSTNLAAPGNQFDGVTVSVVGERILVPNQTTPSQNGIYTWQGSAVPMVRATDADTWNELVGAFTFVEQSATTYDGTGWVCTADQGGTLGTTAVTWTQFSGAGQIIDGIGLLKTGNTLDVRLDGVTIEAPADILRVKALGITDAHVAAANKDGLAGTPGMRSLGYTTVQAAPGDSTLSDWKPPNTTVNFGNKRGIGLADPTAATDIANKQYVDGRTPDATAAVKGLIQLAGDLAGTAAAPAIAAGAVVDADVNASAAIAESKLALASDAAVGTASRRTLGAGALQAMPGNRTLDAISAPVAPLSLNGQRLTNVAAPTTTTDATNKAYVDATATSFAASTAVLDNVPVGTILAYGGSSAPAADWMLCQGQSLDRLTYASLFTAIGTAYGSVDSTHFTLPDLQGRTPIGAGTATGAAGATVHALGTNGGEETHVNVANEAGVMSHGHSVSDPTHAHSNTNGSYLQVSASVSTWLNTTNNANYAVYHAPSTAAAATGLTVVAHPGQSGAPHNNMPPFVTTNYMIKVSARAPQGLFAATESAPVGTVMAYGGVSAPTTDWLMCDGTAISRQTYAELFSVVGTAYGTGDGSTTFNLPDLRGRVPLGAGTATGAAGATAHTLGQKGGEETHTLTIAELAAHDHAGSTDTAPYTTAAGGVASGAGIPPHNATPSGGAWLTSLTIASQGGGAAHNTLPPYVGTNYIIRARSITPTKYSLLGDLSPIGSVTAFVGATPPVDWLACDGSSLLRTDYPELFAVIGTTWGTVDGTHFNLPDLRGRSLIGAGTGKGIAAGLGGTGLPAGTNLSARTLGQWGGEEGHVVSIAEMPSHAHAGTTASSVGQRLINSASVGNTGQPPGGSGQNNGLSNDIPVFTTMTMAYEGSGGAHNTMMPWTVVNYIVKVKQTVATTTTGNSSKSRINFTGDGVKTTFTLRHTLVIPQYDPFIAQIWEADSSGNPVQQAVADIQYADFQNVNVVFASAPADGTRYICTVIG